MAEHKYLIYPIKSDPKDVEGIFNEVNEFLLDLRKKKETLSAEQLYEQVGADVTDWLLTTDLDTIKYERALTQEGQILLGFYGDPPQQTDPIFWTEY